MERLFRPSGIGEALLVAPGVLDRRWRQFHHVAQSLELAHAWRGAYLPQHAAQDEVERLIALQTSSGVPLLASHATAARMHGFDVTGDPRLHITTLDARSIRPRKGLVIHQELPRSDPVGYGGIWVTAPSDTAVDVSRAAPETDVLAVLDAAMRRDVTSEVLAAAIDRAKGRRGLHQVRDWAPFADWRAESPMESRARQEILRAGLPAPDLQVEVRTRAGRPRYLDLGWKAHRLGAEYDGRGAHAETGSEDRTRHNEIADIDWQIFYPTARDVFVGRSAFIGLLATALLRRGYRGPLGTRPSADLIPRPAPGPASKYLNRSRSTWSDSTGSP